MAGAAGSRDREVLVAAAPNDRRNRRGWRSGGALESRSGAHRCGAALAAMRQLRLTTTAREHSPPGATGACALLQPEARRPVRPERKIVCTDRKGVSRDHAVRAAHRDAPGAACSQTAPVAARAARQPRLGFVGLTN
jgi:hypothetical protein